MSHDAQHASAREWRWQATPQERRDAHPGSAPDDVGCPVATEAAAGGDGLDQIAEVAAVREREAPFDRLRVRPDDRPDCAPDDLVDLCLRKAGAGSPPTPDDDVAAQGSDSDGVALVDGGRSRRRGLRGGGLNGGGCAAGAHEYRRDKRRARSCRRCPAHAAILAYRCWATAYVPA